MAHLGGLVTQIKHSLSSTEKTQMNKLTTKQLMVLEFIKQFQQTNGMPPTRHEIAVHFNWKSDNSAQQYIDILIAKEVIYKLDKQQARGIYFYKTN